MLNEFPHAEKLLEKYKDDERINMICGMNINGVTENVAADYLFSRCSSIWGWASWKRVVDGWDGNYSFLDDQESMDLLKDNLDHNYHVGDIRLLPKGVQRVFNMKTYEIETPLKHPRYVIENYEHADI